MNARRAVAPKARDVFRIAAYQGPTEPGALDKNATNALRLLAEAHRNHADFACLPECFLSGYGTPAELRAGAVAATGEWFRDWVRRCAFGEMISIIGFVERRGCHFHNSAAVIHRGRLLGVVRKSIPGSPHEKDLITYRSVFPVFRARGVTFGVIICYEASSIEPALLVAERGARILFEPHYSFISMKDADWHRQRVRNHRIARAVENGVWFVKANTVTEPGRTMGGRAGLGYGDSFILDSIGRVRAEAGLFTCGWITADVPKSELRGTRPSRIRANVPKATRIQVARLYR